MNRPPGCGSASLVCRFGLTDCVALRTGTTTLMDSPSVLDALIKSLQSHTATSDQIRQFAAHWASLPDASPIPCPICYSFYLGRSSLGTLPDGKLKCQRCGEIYSAITQGE
jgi:hypothetical protein